MDVIHNSGLRHRSADRLCLGKEQKMKCEDCSHAEMCKWIDELEGRGCDFGEPCEDAISREAVLKGIEQLKKSPWATDKRGNGFEYLITEALDVVADLCVKQEPPVTPNRQVIENIKADIEAARYGLINDGLDVALRIIDKHIEGSE